LHDDHPDARCRYCTPAIPQSRRRTNPNKDAVFPWRTVTGQLECAGRKQRLTNKKTDRIMATALTKSKLQRKSQPRTTSPRKRRRRFLNSSRSWPTRTPRTPSRCPASASWCWSTARPALDATRPRVKTDPDRAKRVVKFRVAKAAKDAILGAKLKTAPLFQGTLFHIRVPFCLCGGGRRRVMM